ncbi:MAG: nucleotidyl transferase AbiEii/AbiGii toxin family protein [Verrucomicrobiales bacterium]|nr:nucleotidyl transferase AbiEii/AbiGii toxin family protein [Verrucomicrobiales bacterium]
MNELGDVLTAAVEVEGFCRSQHWQFCFIGGIVVQRWGSPRFTQDVDLTLLTGFGDEERHVDGLLRFLHPRRPDAREFALTHRVFLGRTAQGIPVDAALGAFPFEERTIQRASPWFLPDGRALQTCSAEDLLIHKVFAGRDRDWADVETLLIRQFGKLNLDLAREELRPLLELKEEPDSLPRLERMVAKVAARLAT